MFTTDRESVGSHSDLSSIVRSSQLIFALFALELYINKAVSSIAIHLVVRRIAVATVVIRPRLLTVDGPVFNSKLVQSFKPDLLIYLLIDCLSDT